MDNFELENVKPSVEGDLNLNKSNMKKTLIKILYISVIIYFIILLYLAYRFSHCPYCISYGGRDFLTELVSANVFFPILAPMSLGAALVLFGVKYLVSLMFKK